MARIKILIMILGVFIVINCQSNMDDFQNLSPEDRKELAIQKNDVAMQMFQRYLLLHENDSIAYQVLDSLDLAIKYDSTYSLAYQNKAGILTQMGNYQEAVNVLETLVQRQDTTEAMVITHLGMSYDMLSHFYKEKAQKTLEKAIAIYDEKLKEDPENVWMWSERAMLFAYSGSREKALEEIEKIIAKFPDDDMPLSYKEEILRFDREEFIKSMY